jgi:hypothetical protein
MKRTELFQKYGQTAKSTKALDSTITHAEVGRGGFAEHLANQEGNDVSCSKSRTTLPICI